MVWPFRAPRGAFSGVTTSGAGISGGAATSVVASAARLARFVAGFERGFLVTAIALSSHAARAPATSGLPREDQAETPPLTEMAWMPNRSRRLAMESLRLPLWQMM